MASKVPLIENVPSSFISGLASLGSALTLGPIPNVEALAEQLEALLEQEPKTEPQEVFKQRKETAFSEI